MTILHNVNTFPPVDTSWYGKLATLDEYDAEELSQKGIVEAWYWYATGSYEGSGHLIGKDSGGEWAHMDMGHCSCYGPCDGRAGVARYPTIEAMQAAMSADLRAECGNLFAAVTP
jgi:hypothetical protein